MVSPAHPDLWTLALDEPQIGPTELAEAIEREAGRHPLDFRTRLLIRDSLAALGAAWGAKRVAEWLAESPQRKVLEDIAKSELGPPGFSLLHHRIMEPTRTESVLQFFRELGQSIGKPVTIAVGGSVALILAGVRNRRTEDIVDEVPVQIRPWIGVVHPQRRRPRIRRARRPLRLRQDHHGLRMVAGLEEISSGVIRIGEEIVRRQRRAPKDRDIAMVFQNYALYPHMTVYKNMAFGLKLRGVDKARIISA
jgi:hypothetical protein